MESNLRALASSPANLKMEPASEAMTDKRAIAHVVIRAVASFTGSDAVTKQFLITPSDPLISDG
jgi:hypothetical protein